MLETEQKLLHAIWESNLVFKKSVKILGGVHRSKHDYINKMPGWKPARIAQ